MKKTLTPHLDLIVLSCFFTGEWDPATFSMEQMFKANIMQIEQLIRGGLVILIRLLLYACVNWHIDRQCMCQLAYRQTVHVSIGIDTAYVIWNVCIWL